MLAIIGGSGLSRMEALKVERRQEVSTRYGNPSAELVFGTLFERPLVFLARHGSSHSIPPHKINYRANIRALKTAGVSRIIAVAAVGGIHAALAPAVIALPDQLIDYTSGREHTFYDGEGTAVEHIDFGSPYTGSLRQMLKQAASAAGVDVVDGGVYGCTQGPRLETPAEIRRMEQDGCTMVGMTGMPEAALAREDGIDYACFAVVANRAAGKNEGEITMQEIVQNLQSAMDRVHRVLQHLP